MQKIYKVLSKEFLEGTAKREPVTTLDLRRVENGLFRTYVIRGKLAKRTYRNAKLGGEYIIEED